jgi:hypothetical protein
MSKWQPDGKCIEEVAFPRIVCEENGRKITFVNPQGFKVTKIQVDGCLIKDQNQNKCDWLVIAKEVEHFVELKGSDLKTAEIQLTTSIERLSKDYKAGRKFFAFMIVSSVPRKGVKVQELQLKFRKRYNANLIVQKTKLEFPIS